MRPYIRGDQAPPRRLGYARVSTDEQNLDLQLDALKRAGCQRIFRDVITGASTSRNGLDKLIAQLRPGDAVVVWRVDRLGRNFYHLVKVAEELHARGVSFVSLTEGLDTATSIGRAVYRMISVFAELERDTIVQRTVAGIAAARKRGQRFGAKPKMTAEQARQARALIQGGMTAAAVADHYRVGRATLFRHLRAHDEGTRKAA